LPVSARALDAPIAVSPGSTHEFEEIEYEIVVWKLSEATRPRFRAPGTGGAPVDRGLCHFVGLSSLESAALGDRAVGPREAKVSKGVR
jgi:hypothetical protein